jgi:large subunit ribosomal protein L21
MFFAQSAAPPPGVTQGGMAAAPEGRQVMYAVIKTGGKQYKVASGDVILVEKLDGEAGASITLAEVLMIGDGASITVGAPTVKGASVAAEVVDQVKGDKVIIFKKYRRHNYRRKNGHRQKLTALKITGINAA